MQDCPGQQGLGPVRSGTSRRPKAWYADHRGTLHIDLAERMWGLEGSMREYFKVTIHQHPMGIVLPCAIDQSRRRPNMADAR